MFFTCSNTCLMFFAIPSMIDVELKSFIFYNRIDWWEWLQSRVVIFVKNHDFFTHPFFFWVKVNVSTLWTLICLKISLFITVISNWLIYCHSGLGKRFWIPLIKGILYQSKGWTINRKSQHDIWYPSVDCTSAKMRS